MNKEKMLEINKTLSTFPRGGNRIPGHMYKFLPKTGFKICNKGHQDWAYTGSSCPECKRLKDEENT